MVKTASNFLDFFICVFLPKSVLYTYFTTTK
nr:MAG TPA: hypothetical protein [Caudoviricetes sp.]DAZ38487.1 MAG TPA: hypothetical protein [Caudoviricetes sp.]